jgi:hypothetical protein
MPASFRNVEEGIVVEGLGPMIRVLHNAEHEIEPELKRRLKQGVGGIVLPVARANAPYGSKYNFGTPLRDSLRVSVTQRGASIFSTKVSGGAINYGAWTTGPGRGPHIKRERASHYMTRAVQSTKPRVEAEVVGLLDWLTHELEDGSNG